MGSEASLLSAPPVQKLVPRHHVNYLLASKGYGNMLLSWQASQGMANTKGLCGGLRQERGTRTTSRWMPLSPERAPSEISGDGSLLPQMSLLWSLQVALLGRSNDSWLLLHACCFKSHAPHLMPKVLAISSPTRYRSAITAIRIIATLVAIST